MAPLPPSAPTRRGVVLDEVKQIICVERNDQHGAPENTFPMIAAAWTAYLQHFKLMPNGVTLKPSDVAELMVLFKDCRFRANPKNLDSAKDRIGYAAIAIELREAEAGKSSSVQLWPNAPPLPSR